MKKHSFLHVDLISTAKLSPALSKKIQKWLTLASPVLERLVKEKVIGTPCSRLQVSLLICGDTRIRNLNREHRGKDKVTDVLSFPAYDDLRKKTPVNESELFLGDMAICHPQVIRQSKEFRISYMDEFIHLFFHGLLHLMGYDHEVSFEEERLMQEWEEKALGYFSEQKKGSR